MPYNDDILSQYANIFNTYLSNPQAADAIELTAGGAGGGLDNFYNSPGYQLTQGPNATPNDPLQTFFNSPNYQYLYGTNNAQMNPMDRFMNSGMYQTLYGTNNAQADPAQRFLRSGMYEALYGKNNNQSDLKDRFLNSGAYRTLFGENNAQADPLQRFLNSSTYQGIYGKNNAQLDPAQRFFNSAQAKTMYGSDRANKMSADIGAGTYDPTKAFQADPGFDFMQQRALKAVNDNSAARGLLESGATQRDLLETSQGLQNQEYDKWLNMQQGSLNKYQGDQTAMQGNYENRQAAVYDSYVKDQMNSLNQYQNSQANALGAYQGQQQAVGNDYRNNLQSQFGNYQQQLAGLANMGAANSGAQNAFNLGTGLGTNVGNYYSNLGQLLSNAQLGTGSNISSLFGNLGSANASMLLNVAGAMGNNLFRGNEAQAQLNAANLARQAGGQNAQYKAAGMQQAGGMF